MRVASTIVQLLFIAIALHRSGGGLCAQTVRVTPMQGAAIEGTDVRFPENGSVEVLQWGRWVRIPGNELVSLECPALLRHASGCPCFQLLEVPVPRIEPSSGQKQALSGSRLQALLNPTPSLLRGRVGESESSREEILEYFAFQLWKKSFRGTRQEVTEWLRSLQRQLCGPAWATFLSARLEEASFHLRALSPGRWLGPARLAPLLELAAETAAGWEGVDPETHWLLSACERTVRFQLEEDKSVEELLVTKTVLPLLEASPWFPLVWCEVLEGSDAPRAVAQRQRLAEQLRALASEGEEFLREFCPRKAGQSLHYRTLDGSRLIRRVESVQREDETQVEVHQYVQKRGEPMLPSRIWWRQGPFWLVSHGVQGEHPLLAWPLRQGQRFVWAHGDFFYEAVVSGVSQAARTATRTYRGCVVLRTRSLYEAGLREPITCVTRSYLCPGLGVVKIEQQDGETVWELASRGWR